MTARSMLASMVVSPSYRVEWPRITHGSGIHLIGEDGRRYIDGSGCSSGVSSIGHGSERVARVLAEQARTIAVIPTHQFSSEIVERYCAELVSFAPDGMRLAWTATSGSDAVENAMKLAVQYQRLVGSPGRTVVLGRRQSWHGATVGALGVGGNLSRREPFEELLFEAPTIAPAYAYRSGLSDEECARMTAEDVARVIKQHGADRVAAFVVEPIVGATLGAVVPPPGYLARVREICDETGVLLIADEVLTGAGRTGERFAVDREGVVPDIIAFGKGFSGGYVPLSGIIVSGRVANPFVAADAPFLSGHTHACSPITAAVGIEVLDIIRELLASGAVAASSEAFQSALRRSLGNFESVGDVRGVGMLAGVEFVADRATRRPHDPSEGFLDRVVSAALDRGLVTYPGRGSAGGGRGEHLKLAPPLITTTEQAVEIADILADAVAEAQRIGRAA